MASGFGSNATIYGVAFKVINSIGAVFVLVVIVSSIAAVATSLIGNKKTTHRLWITAGGLIVTSQILMVIRNFVQIVLVS